MEFYSYLWLRKDRTPLYVGKGTGTRAFIRGSHHLRPPVDLSLILIFPQDNEAAAMQSEKDLIALFGRKDLGTGILRNFTDGGDGSSGYKHTKAALRKMSLARKGKPNFKRRGIKHTVDARQRISDGHKGQVAWNRGRKTPPATRKKQSEARMGVVPWNKGVAPTDEARKNFRLGWLKRSRVFSKATKQRMSAAQKGRVVSAEGRQRMSEAQKEAWLKHPLRPTTKGYRHSAAAKRRMSAALTGRKASLETRQKMRASAMGHPNRTTQAGIAKMRVTHKGKHYSPATEFTSESSKAAWTKRKV